MWQRQHDIAINITRLPRITLHLYDHLVQRGVNSLDPRQDYYWSIPLEDRLDVTKKPTQQTLGQLSDDLAELARIGDGDIEPVGYASVSLSSVLRELGETTMG